MIEITTSKGKFVVVDVSTIGAIPYVKLLVNNKLICEISEATEEDAKIVVDMYNIGNFNILSYKPSLEYLLTSKGIDINNGNWYLFKKI